MRATTSIRHDGYLRIGKKKTVFDHSREIGLDECAVESIRVDRVFLFDGLEFVEEGDRHHIPHLDVEPVSAVGSWN